MATLSFQQIEELKSFNSPTICNALDAFVLPSRTKYITSPGLFLRTADEIVVGYAVTAQVSAQYPGIPDGGAKLYEYYDTVRKTEGPVIACIQDIDNNPIGSFWGEVQATVHKSLGAVATLTDGGVRDIDEVNQLGFAMFSTQIHVSHAYVHVENYNCPVTICGLLIRPGDLIHADKHGAVVIPHEIAPFIADACRKDAISESYLIEPCRKAISSGVRPTIEEIRSWRQKLIESKSKIR